ncbi:hypothetical protein [Actinoallomurus sp. CA-142502]|uniref:hypothetical protein n=1 Tax=Actinoallomurus sp. CA-142502 TaxID=3239885 RepID=UPI003D9353BC
MTDGPMRPDGPMRRDPGRWCEEHQRYECTKHGKGGGSCHGSRIAGTPTCRMHAGVSGKVAKTQGEAITAWSALSGKPVVSNTEAVLGMLQMSWLRVHLYAALLERQVNEAQAEAAREPAVRAAVAEAYDEVFEERSQGAPPVGPGVGLIGQQFSGVKDIGIFATGEAIRGLAQLEAQERDRCVRYAKTAHDMGIAEQQVQLAEQQAMLLAGVVSRVADGLLAAVLGLLNGGAEDVGRAADGVRQAWPAWIQEIVPRELRAVAGRSDAA